MLLTTLSGEFLLDLVYGRLQRDVALYEFGNLLVCVDDRRVIPSTEALTDLR